MPDNINPTVMIVDDAKDIRTMLRLWLERNGCRVVEAATGRAAVRVAQRERPELILMDLYMPELDGAVAAARIRECAGLERVPIVAISGYGESGMGAQLSTDPAAAGFNEYLTKPFEPERLAEVLKRYVRKGKGANAA